MARGDLGALIIILVALVFFTLAIIEISEGGTLYAHRSLKNLDKVFRSWDPIMLISPLGFTSPVTKTTSLLGSKSKDIQKQETPKKPRFLCLHGHGSNAAILKTELNNWPDYVLEKMDLVFIDGPFSVDDGTSKNKRFEWFSIDTVNTTNENFDEGISYIEDCMIELGPFDGVLGFSQGAIVTGALPGMQQQGVSLTKVEKIRHVVIISGAKFGGKTFPLPKLAETAFSSKIDIPSLHIFGETDIARPNAPELVEAYVDPLVIYHHGGHEVPKLDEEGLKIMFEFLKRIYS